MAWQIVHEHPMCSIALIGGFEARQMDIFEICNILCLLLYHCDKHEDELLTTFMA